MPLIPPKLIESERLQLRRTLESDLPALLEMNSDAKVTRFLGFVPWQAMADAEAWFQRISALQVTGSALEFVIVAKKTVSVIGRCSLFSFDEINAQAGVGYVLGRDHWGRGYMREALTALIDCAFLALNLRRLEASVEPPNIASSGLLKRLGFIREGVLRERWISHEGPMDAEVYGLLRHEWFHSVR